MLALSWDEATKLLFERVVGPEMARIIKFDKQRLDLWRMFSKTSNRQAPSTSKALFRKIEAVGACRILEAKEEPDTSQNRYKLSHWHPSVDLQVARQRILIPTSPL